MQLLYTLQFYALEDDYVFDDDELDEFLHHDILEQKKAIFNEDRMLITEFNHELNQEFLKKCNICNEYWFDLYIDAEEYHRKCAMIINNDNSSKFSIMNLMNSDDISADLSLLSIIWHERYYWLSCHIQICRSIISAMLNINILIISFILYRI